MSNKSQATMRRDEKIRSALMHHFKHQDAGGVAEVLRVICGAIELRGVRALTEETTAVLIAMLARVIDEEGVAAVMKAIRSQRGILDGVLGEAVAS